MNKTKTKTRASARIIGAPPIPTSNPSGDAVLVPPHPVARSHYEERDPIAALLARVREAVSRARTRIHA